MLATIDSIANPNIINKHQLKYCSVDQTINDGNSTHLLIEGTWYVLKGE